MYTPYIPFYRVKLGFTGVIHNFLFFALKHKLWVLVITASQAVLTCTHNQFFEQKKKSTTICSLKIIIFTAVKNCNVLHGHVFVKYRYSFMMQILCKNIIIFSQLKLLVVKKKSKRKECQGRFVVVCIIIKINVGSSGKFSLFMIQRILRSRFYKNIAQTVLRHKTD